MTRLDEAAKAALKAAYIARRDTALHPYAVQLYRVVTTTFAKQRDSLRITLARRKESLNPTRLIEGIEQDINVILDDLFIEFKPQFVRDLARITKAAMNTAAQHKSSDFGYQISFNLSNPQAEAALAAHCGEQITKIDESTRRTIQRVILEGQKANKSYSDIAKDIIAKYGEFAEPQSGPGVQNRADGIVIYELGTAYETASNSAAGMLASRGVPMTKEWSPTGDEKQCPICSGNAAVGPIPFDSPFPSGHMHPLAHFRCRCSALHEPDIEAMDRILGVTPPGPPKPEPKPAPKPRGIHNPPQLAIKKDIANLKQKVGVLDTGDDLRIRLAELKAEEAMIRVRIGTKKSGSADLEKQLRTITLERRRLTDELMALSRDPTAAEQKAMAAFLKAQSQKAPTVAASSTLGPVKTKAVDPAVDWIGKTIKPIDANGVSLDKSITIKSTYDDTINPNRDRARARGNEIFIPNNARDSMVVHEYGHVMDFQSSLRGKNGVRFRDYRTRGEPLKKLSDLHPGAGYGPNEVTKPDKFRHEYCGRVYYLDKEMTKVADSASEITSMGLQYLYEDPIGFLRRDPEYFELMIHQIRGVHWMYPEDLAKLGRV